MKAFQFFSIFCLLALLVQAEEIVVDGHVQLKDTRYAVYEQRLTALGLSPTTVDFPKETSEQKLVWLAAFARAHQDRSCHDPDLEEKRSQVRLALRLSLCQLCADVTAVITLGGNAVKKQTDPICDEAAIVWYLATRPGVAKATLVEYAVVMISFVQEMKALRLYYEKAAEKQAA